MKSQIPTGPSFWVLWPSVLLASVAGIVGAALVNAWLLPRGHEAVWVWKLRTNPLLPLPWTVPSALVFLLVALAAFDGIRSGRQPSRVACVGLVLALTVANAGLMAGMIRDDREFPFRASAVILGDMSMGYYVQAHRMGDVREYLRDAATRTDPKQVPERVATHPPGPVLYFWAARRWLASHPRWEAGLRRYLENWSADRDLEGTVVLCRRVSTIQPSVEDVVRSFWPGVALTLGAVLIVPVGFALGALMTDRRSGVMAAVFAAVVPSLLCFVPSIDGLPAVIGGLVVLGWVWSLRSGVGLPALLAGALWALGLAWTFGLLALGPVLLVVGVVHWRDSRSAVGLKRAALGLVIGVVGTYAAGFLAVGYNPVASMVGSLRAQAAVMHETQRPYGLSVAWNLYDFGVFAGPSLVVMAMAGLVAGLSGSDRSRLSVGLGWGVVATLALLLVSGSTRGEVGRIWGFLMPLLAPTATGLLLPLRNWTLMGAGLLVLIGQLSLAIAIHCHWSLVAP